MKTFVYKNYQKDGRVVFQCHAESILEADKKYTAAGFGNPEKQGIGCLVVCADTCAHQMCINAKKDGIPT